jgi:hypothetical protein
MKHVLFLTIGLGLVGAMLPGSALGKGASEAAITGPGLSGPLELGGSGEPGSGELGTIAETAGFFAAVFGQSPDPMVAQRPAGDLGPRYVITYLMPGPNGEHVELVQHLYPYAKPHPVTYMRPGQELWATERTRGGWYVAWYSGLKERLVEAGLPATPPAADDETSLPVVGTVAAVAAVAGLVLLLAVALRRRRPRARLGSQTRTVTASRSAS